MEERSINREKYIANREYLIDGQVNGEVWEIFYDYWKIHRKEEYKDPQFDEFVQSFLQYLQRTFYPSISNRVVEYYDELFGVNQVMNKEGKILKTF